MQDANGEVQVQVSFFDRLLTAEGLLYIGLKAARDFVTVLAISVGADTFVSTPDGWRVALVAAASTTAFRVGRYLLDRLGSPEI